MSDVLRDADAYEAGYRAALRNKRLVFEVGVAESGRLSLATHLNGLIKALGPKARSELAARYPATTVIAIVQDAVFAYADGTLWPNMLIRDTEPPSLGRSFYLSLVNLDLARFPSFDGDNAQVYVSRILAHGGIPNGYLPRYFRFLEEEDRYAAGDAAAYRTRLEGMGATAQSLPKPIVRFLRDTGPVGLDFLRRTHELLFGDDELENVDAIADRAGLPRHVVSACREFRLAEPTSGQNNRASRRIAARVRFVPGVHDSPVMAMRMGPEQDVRWTLSAEGAVERSVEGSDDASGWQRRFHTRPLTTVELPLPVAVRWTLSSEGPDGSTHQRKTFRAMAEDGILLFDGRTGALVDDPKHSPSVVTTLSRAMLVAQTGRARLLQEYPPLDAGSWEGWTAAEWELGGDGDATLVGEIGGHEVRLLLLADRPAEASLSDPVADVVDEQGLPVYAMPPRLLSLPWESADVANRWSARIRLGGVWRELPIGPLEAMDASIAALLAGVQVANCRLELRGSLGESVRHEFVLVRGLQVTQSGRALYPDDASARVSVTVSPGVEIATRPEDGKGSRLEVTLRPGTTIAPIVATGADGASVTLLLSSETLAWAIARTEDDASVLSASRAVVELTQLSDLGRSFLQLQLPAAVGAARIIAECDGAQIQELKSLAASSARRNLTISLGVLSTTLESFRDREVQLLLQTSEAKVPIAVFRQNADLSLAGAMWRRGDHGPSLLLFVESTASSLDLLVRVEDRQRPWLPPHRLQVNACNPSEPVTLAIEGALRPGSYRVTVGQHQAWRGEVWSDRTAQEITLTQDDLSFGRMPASESMPEMAASNEALTGLGTRAASIDRVVNALAGDGDGVAELSADDIADVGAEVVLILGDTGRSQADRWRIACGAARFRVNWGSAMVRSSERFGLSEPGRLRAYLALLGAGARVNVVGTGGELTMLDPTLLLAAISAERPADARQTLSILDHAGIPTENLYIDRLIGGQPQSTAKAWDSCRAVLATPFHALTAAGLQRAHCLLASGQFQERVAELLEEQHYAGGPWTAAQLADKPGVARLAQRLSQLEKSLLLSEKKTTLMRLHATGLRAAIDLHLCTARAASAWSFLDRLQGLWWRYVENRALVVQLADLNLLK